MMDGIELLPCPFCGGNVTVDSYPVWDTHHGLMYSALIRHQCEDDETAMYLKRNFKTEQEARKEMIKAWNRRANDGR